MTLPSSDCLVLAVSWIDEGGQERFIGKAIFVVGWRATIVPWTSETTDLLSAVADIIDQCHWPNIDRSHRTCHRNDRVKYWVARHFVSLTGWFAPRGNRWGQLTREWTINGTRLVQSNRSYIEFRIYWKLFFEGFLLVRLINYFNCFLTVLDLRCWISWVTILENFLLIFF